MKKEVYRTIAAIGFFLVLAAVSAQAQSAGEIRTKVPFDFRLGTLTLQPGEYIVRPIFRNGDGATDMLWDNATTGQYQNDTEGWNTNGFALSSHRSQSLSDLIFTWECRPPSHYDAFNVRVRISDGREGQVEVRGGSNGSYRERNAEVGKTYTFMVQGCNKGTFGSTCTGWSQIRVRNV